MIAERLNPQSFATVPEAPASEPFFFTAPIPLPEQLSPVAQAGYIEDVWDLAEQDFVRMATPDGVAENPIRNFFVNNQEGGRFTLSELGELLGVNNYEYLRKVRSALNVGIASEKTDVTYWELTGMETAQFLVGVVAKMNHKIYTRISSYRDFNSK